MKTMNLGTCILFVACLNRPTLGLLDLLFPEPPPTLEKYNVDPDSLTVSGISSGGLMAPQLHFIFSSMVKGAGIFSGGPYLCGNNLAAAALCFVAPELQNVQDLISLSNHYNQSGKIDNISNLSGSKVYIFHGMNDTVAKPQAGKNLNEMYLNYGANVKAEFTKHAGHGQPVNENGFGGPCATVNPQQHYINECGYNGAYEMFRWLYGDDIVAPLGTFRGDGELRVVNQKEFISDPLIAGMSDKAQIYIPKNCANKTKTCRFHVALHGCISNRQFIGDDFAIKSQYIDTAELNDIIILFPQTTISATSPIVCYDWIGSTGPWFGTKWGSQPNVILKMMKRVLGQDLI